MKAKERNSDSLISEFMTPAHGVSAVVYRTPGKVSAHSAKDTSFTWGWKGSGRGRGANEQSVSIVMENSYVAQEILASQKGLCSLDLVS
jgi:hypothetical protein